MQASSFRDLRVWRQAIDLALMVYRSTEAFPKHELYGLAQQMRRAAVSIASNIAEGKGRRSDKEIPAISVSCKRIAAGAGNAVSHSWQVRILNREAIERSSIIGNANRDAA